MRNGSMIHTAGGEVSVTADGNIVLEVIDAAFGTPADVGLINVTSTNGNISGNDNVTPTMRAKTINATAISLGSPAQDLVFHSDIQGTVTLSYVTDAYVSVLPNFNVALAFVDLGTGLINSSAARSAGNQRGDTGGLEEVGFIDVAVFSDISLFVVDGFGVALPPDQDDTKPEDRPRESSEVDIRPGSVENTFTGQRMVESGI
jgi:hypothetical protein